MLQPKMARVPRLRNPALYEILKKGKTIVRKIDHCLPEVKGGNSLQGEGYGEHSGVMGKKKIFFKHLFLFKLALGLGHLAGSVG